VTSSRVSRVSPALIIHQRAPAGERKAAAIAGRALRDFAKRLRLGRAELSLWLAGDATLRRLNRQYRGVDAATDVLSFPAAESPAPIRQLGDLVVSLQTTRRCARELGIAFDDELKRYLAHGLLHLLGHDHQRSREAHRMASEEGRLLGGVGMIDRVRTGR
jgi:probable rRNA maturation factor